MTKFFYFLPAPEGKFIMSIDIKTTLSYATDDKTRPYLYAYHRSDEERKNNPRHESDYGGTTSKIETVVHDARAKGLTLDKNAFELVKQTTSLSTEDFYTNPEKIAQVYYSEIAELIKEATGAAYVDVFHHQVRNEDKNNGSIQNLNTSVQGYAMGIHSDAHPQAADELFLGASNKEPNNKYLTGRFLYINAWRNISEEPIGNNHLAVCDETSLVKPDDYITTDLFGEGYHIQQYRMSDRNAAQHRWYYYSKMKKDEVLLFKQWDSDRTLSGRVCFHTAFSDPNAPKEAPPRQSIEARAIAYFPDHKPNTCPAIPKEETVEDPSNDSKNVTQGASKVLSVVQTIHTWPPNAKSWLKLEVSKGQIGIRTIAETLAKDEYGQLGLKKLSKNTKAKIVDELLKDDKFEQKLKSLVAQMNMKEDENKSSNQTKLM